MLMPTTERKVAEISKQIRKKWDCGCGQLFDSSHADGGVNVVCFVLRLDFRKYVIAFLFLKH